ncbi:beta-lactamase superfamily II metal-dependent hydrolase [Rhizobium pisi]
MQTLRVRIYNVLFGDAILISIPEVDENSHEHVVHILIDVGNALAGSGGDDAALKDVLENIQEELAGEPVDLYVMTHEHMDHVQGPLFGSQKLGISLAAKQVWMTASSAEDYYQRFSEARKKRSLALALHKSVTQFLKKSAAPIPPGISALLAINNPRASKDCVDHIRKLAPETPLYVHRQADIDGRHPFRRTSIRVLAPEEDTSIYYGRLGPSTFGVAGANVVPTSLPSGAITPPAGVSAGDFFDLIRFRSSGMAANLRTIDKAANNSSVAIELEWEGWRLLFPGDAEEKSWEIMNRLDLLRPVHFLKVSHHGSSNGTPSVVTEKVLPANAHDDRPRHAVVSTHVGAYAGVPDQATLELIASRASLLDTRSLQPGAWFDLEFPAPAAPN